MKSVLRSPIAMALAFACVSFSVGNEFIKSEKEKVFYPSCQQCLELHATIITATNQALNALNSFNKLIIDVQKGAITEINEYLDGEKGCFLQTATKKQRADFYAHNAKVKRKIDEIGLQIALMQDQLEKLLSSQINNESNKSK